MTKQGPPFDRVQIGPSGVDGELSFELFFAMSLRRRVWLILDKRLTFSRQGELLDQDLALKEGYAYLQRLKGPTATQAQP
jgi:hypothetical protein